MASHLGEIVVDSTDPRALATFWSDVLGWETHREGDEQGEWYWMTAPGGDEATGLTLTFVPVPEPKTVKNRLHIDLSPVGCAQDEELGRLLSLGAVRADVGQGEQPWIVLADPEGNEFCLLRRRLD